MRKPVYRLLLVALLLVACTPSLPTPVEQPSSFSPSPTSPTTAFPPSPTSAPTLTPSPTPVPPTATVPVVTETPSPPPSSTPRALGADCPSDPAQWRAVSYKLPTGKELYKLDPPCAMGLVEEAFRQLQDYAAERADRWTKEDEAHYFYYGAYTSPLTGKRYPAADLDETWGLTRYHCKRFERQERERAVYYTTDPDDPRRVVLYVIYPPYRAVHYDCETGEEGEEYGADGYAGVYLTLIYDGGTWKVGLSAEEYIELPPNVDPDATILTLLQLQGRR